MGNKNIYIGVITILLGIALFPLLLNWMLLRQAIIPVVGDGVTWLSFWPVYLSAIASFGMIYFTYRSLQQNREQLLEMKKLREEEERARLVFSVIVYQQAFMLKISNVGKRNVYDATIHFNDDFLNELLEDIFQEGYRQLSNPFFVEAGTSRYLFIGWCEKINKAWKDNDVVIKMNGSYNGVYSIAEEIKMNLFLDKTFILVQGDLETTVGHIKKGLVVQNDTYMPIQKSLDSIATTLQKVDKSLAELSDHVRKQLNDEDNAVALDDIEGLDSVDASGSVKQD